MAITQTGSVLVLDKLSSPAIDASASGTAAITVPADCTLIVIGVGGYSDVAGRLAANGTFDIGGNTSLGVGGAANESHWQAALHYIVSPATGAVNLDWQWGGGAGSALTDTSPQTYVAFFKGVDTGTPTRDSDGAQAIAAATVTTPSLTAQSGDLIVAMGSTTDAGAANLTFTWSGATELQGRTNVGEVDSSLATASPSGAQTVGFTATGADESAVAAWVFRAADTGTTVGLTGVSGTMSRGSATADLSGFTMAGKVGTSGAGTEAPGLSVPLVG